MTREQEDTAALDATYKSITSDLVYRFEDIHDPETVATTVAEVRETFEAQARIRTFLPVLVARFAKERLEEAGGRLHTTKPELLFVCVQNAGRSQLAAALTTQLSVGKVHVRSAGSQPTDVVNPLVVQVLAERGIKLTGVHPKPLTDDIIRAADVIVTMGCGDSCPHYPGRRYLDWDIPDPADADIEGVRDIRDLIQARVTNLLRDLNL